MQLAYGTYFFESNALEITSRTEVMRNGYGRPFARKNAVHVRGFISTSGQADASTKMSLMQTALATPYLDLVFNQDTGVASATVLRNAGSISGVVITRGPDFPVGKGAEYANLRTFEFEAEAEYYLAGAATLLLKFTESVQLGGGQPFYVMKRAINGPPQKQLVYPQTEFTATQQGSAEGLTQYPAIPGPLFPDALMEAPTITRTAPERVGLRGYQKWGISWSYRFASADQLVASPNLWIG